MHYLTFGDEMLASGLRDVTERLRRLGCKAGQLARLLQMFKPHKYPHQGGGAAGYYADVFSFLHARCKRQEASLPPEGYGVLECGRGEALLHVVDLVIAVLRT